MLDDFLPFISKVKEHFYRGEFSREDVDDAVQKFFLKLLEHPELVKDVRNHERYMAKGVKNNLVDVGRHNTASDKFATRVGLDAPSPVQRGGFSRVVSAKKKQARGRGSKT